MTLTVIPYQSGKVLRCSCGTSLSSALQSTRDVTAAAREAGKVAEQAAARKRAKYAELPPVNSFMPIAVQALGPTNVAAMELSAELGHGWKQTPVTTGRPRNLFQRLSVSVQRFNTALFRETFFYPIYRVAQNWTRHCQSGPTGRKHVLSIRFR